MDTVEARLGKIQKLLAQAESTKFPEEAKSFTAKAHELMVQWQIDETMLRLAKPGERNDEIVVDREIVIDFSPYQSPKLDLLNAVCRANDCRVVFVQGAHWTGGERSQGKRIKHQRAEIVGYSRDIAFVKMMFASLMIQSANEFTSPEVQADLWAETSHPGHRIRWRNAYMNGYNMAIGVKLAERRQAVQKTVTDDRLLPALVDKRREVDNEFKSLFPTLRALRGSAGEGGGSGNQHGYNAGRRADMGDRSVGGNRKEVGA